MPRIDKKTKEAQLQQVWRMLLNNKTHEEIAIELNVATKTIQRISIELDKRYGEMQKQKTDNTLYLECNLFKNRMLTLYRGLEQIVSGSDGQQHGGMEKAKCAEVAVNICIDILKMESEVIKSVRDLNIALRDHDKGNRLFNAIRGQGQQEQQQESTDNGNNAIDNMVSRGLADPEEGCSTT